MIDLYRYPNLIEKLRKADNKWCGTLKNGLLAVAAADASDVEASDDVDGVNELPTENDNDIPPKDESNNIDNKSDSESERNMMADAANEDVFNSDFVPLTEAFEKRPYESISSLNRDNDDDSNDAGKDQRDYQTDVGTNISKKRKLETSFRYNDTSNSGQSDRLLKKKKKNKMNNLRNIS